MGWKINIWRRIFKWEKKWNGKGLNKNNEIEYEIKDGNGKVKEYNDYGFLIYEGEYLKGKRNGKGKGYYTSGELYFEAEYLYGKKWNGKIYNPYNNKGELVFEGEYLNGKRWSGKGKEYYSNGKIKFEV